MDKMIRTLQELVSINSVAEPGKDGMPYGPGPTEAIRYILGVCDSFGFRTCLTENYGYAEIGEGEELIGILSHLDVVPAGDGWTYDPFGGQIAGDRIYGRGTIDDKGPTVASIYAMKDILEDAQNKGFAVNKRIRIILGQTEENGDWKDMEAYRESEELPTYGFTPDGDFPAIHCEKGVMVIRITMPLAGSGIRSVKCGNAPNMVPAHAEIETSDGIFSGEGRPYHGCAPWGGYNAMDDLLGNMRTKSCLTDTPFFRMYESLFEGKIYGEGIGCEICDEESGMLTVNPGKITSNDDYIELLLDIRYPVTADPQPIINKIKSHAAEYGADAECIHHMEPVYMDKNGPVMQNLLEAYRTHTGDCSDPIAIGGGTYARAMPGIIAFGPNFPGHENREHQNDEYILIEDFQKLRKIYKDALMNLLAV